MPINTVELINAASIICDEHNMRVTLRQSAKGAMATGVSAFIGGMVSIF